MWTFIFIISDILLIVSLLTLLFADSDKRELLRVVIIICLILSIFGIALSITYANVINFNSKRYTYSTKIKQTIVNDSIVEIDTFYVITPK